MKKIERNRKKRDVFYVCCMQVAGGYCQFHKMYILLIHYSGSLLSSWFTRSRVHSFEVCD